VKHSHENSEITLQQAIYSVVKIEIHESDSGHIKFCADHVRQHDPDRYLCTMFSPPSVRPALFSLYAFNCELALVRERVQESILGEMRFQWWRDQVENAYGGSVRPDGIAGSLYDFIKQYTPARVYLDDLINNLSGPHVVKDLIRAHACMRLGQIWQVTAFQGQDLA